MKIKSIEYENFRNFKERGKIECATDGKVTIIYGRIGDGKTTLHQLFQWVFYGNTHFNKTATDKLYNLEFESEQTPGSIFEVTGRINFQHVNVDYSLRRSAFYTKGLDGSTKKDREEVDLQMKDSDNNWKPVKDEPKVMIERLIPSNLAEYFFFDGETMIADLSRKSMDSANKLKKTLHSIFELDVLETAIAHIGNQNAKTSVVGKLFLGRGDTNNAEIVTAQTNIANAQSLIERYKSDLTKYKREKEEKNELIRTISEQIGSIKSKAEYEAQRRGYQKSRDFAQAGLEQNQSDFGDAVMEAYPKLLISKAILDTSDILKLKVNKAELPVGLGKTLIHYLLSKDNEKGVCICGNPLCEKEKAHIEYFLNLLPPKSYTSIYQEFIAIAKNWGSGHNKEKLENYIRLAIGNSELVADNEESIRIIDQEQKKSPDIEMLVEERLKAEERIEKLDDLIVRLETELKKADIYLKKQNKDFEKLLKDDEKTKAANRKIQIMEEVGRRFEERLNRASDTYSQKLETNIQTLLGTLLDNDRTVKVSPDFAIKVYDNFGDESKSEGQFAMTSFAYIGGIFNMLKSEEHLSNKEYPLVLDAPFSKLDPTKIQRVADTLPSFAPQVIIFSKDSLQHVFEKEQIGRVWTIQSNKEQNVAVVKEGYYWK